jgi:hypothetical protein
MHAERRVRYGLRTGKIRLQHQRCDVHSIDGARWYDLRDGAGVRRERRMRRLSRGGDVRDDLQTGEVRLQHGNSGLRPKERVRWYDLRNRPSLRRQRRVRDVLDGSRVWIILQPGHLRLQHGSAILRGAKIDGRGCQLRDEYGL